MSGYHPMQRAMVYHPSPQGRPGGQGGLDQGPQPVGLPLPPTSNPSPNIYHVTKPQKHPELVVSNRPSPAGSNPGPGSGIVENGEDEAEESDWEKEIDPESGSLFYVVPYDGQ